MEEDTEETFLLNDSKFYITVQALDSDGITKGDLEGMLKDYADDDGWRSRLLSKPLTWSNFMVFRWMGNVRVNLVAMPV